MAVESEEKRISEERGGVEEEGKNAV